MNKKLIWTAALILAAGCGSVDPDEPGALVPGTVDDDASLPYVEINGTRLHATTFGDSANPMIVVLHGGPGADYRSLLPLRVLADDGYYVIFWDQRGAGLSRRHDASDITLEAYRDDLRLLIDHYTSSANQPIAFIGHSWGAMYATMFVNEFGDLDGRIRGAVLSEPGAFTKKQLDAYFERLFGSVAFVGEQLNDMTWSGQFITAREHARADYLGMVQSAGGFPAEHHDPDNPSPQFRMGAIAQKRLLAIAERDGFDWTTNLGGFTKKVLFLRGSLNEAMPLSHQMELASSYPDAEVVTIEGVGHDMIWERTDEYLNYVRQYFAAIGFGGGIQ